MANYNQLLKRLNALGSSRVERLYSITHLTDAEDHHDKKIYGTPDEALKDVYEDAHKHGVKYLHLDLWIFDIGGDLVGNFLGYSWKGWDASPEELYGGRHLPESNVRIWGCPICGRYDPLVYPNPSPEYELFDLVGDLFLEWCQEVGYPSIEAYEVHSIEFLNKNEPGRYSLKDMNMYRLIQQYRRAGYQVDYPHEVKNSVEVNIDSYGGHMNEEGGRV